jgi:4,5:9,10-diseco-3-hydroxy-5,9,17-trioxoandrosta-1(10),2-diene-4-oate hydrolase
VEKLIVMGPGGIEARETYFKMPGIQKMVSQFVGSGFDRPGLRRLRQLLAYDPHTITDELLEQRFNILQTQPKAVLARMSITDLTPELGKLRGPLLGFWGVEDQFCPASGYEKILRAGSRFIAYSRCGLGNDQARGRLNHAMPSGFLKLSARPRCWSTAGRGCGPAHRRTVTTAACRSHH